METAKTDTKTPDRLAATGVRLLIPENTQIFEGAFALLHCAVSGENTYRGVFAVLLSPIRHPLQFISLRYTDLDDKEKEIGVIATLADFPADSQTLVRANLAKHYYEKIITRIHRVQYKHGLLFFKADIEPDGTGTEFYLHWSHNSAEEYGEKGKVLIDVYENRLIIPDVSRLPAADRREFESFIYW